MSDEVKLMLWFGTMLTIVVVAICASIVLYAHTPAAVAAARPKPCLCNCRVEK